jgi:hypothetical protein
VLSNAPLISTPDYNRDYILYVSASTILVAEVLIQLGDENREHVIYYVSKNLSGPPLKYKNKEKLALVVILAVQKLRHYILLRTNKVVADSSPMQYLLSHRQIFSMDRYPSGVQSRIFNTQEQESPRSHRTCHDPPL